MTPKQEKYFKSLIKALHTSKRYQGYFKDEKEEYKALLQESFGVQSSTKLTLNQLILFVDYMNFKDVALPTYERRDDAFGARCSKAQEEMMRGLWYSFARTKTDEALLAFVKHQTGKRYLHIHMLTKQEAQKIIPTLQTMKANTIIS